MKQLLSFVIPCYHSELTLKEVVADIFRTVEKDGRYDCEVVLVNDNPPDATWRLIQQLCQEDTRVKGVCMAHNFGQHAALMAGFGLVQGQVVLCLDDDGQTPPTEAFKLIDGLSEEVDVVYADYPESKFSNLFRRLGSDINDAMARWLLKKPKGLYLSSYIAAKRYVIDEVVSYRGPYPYVDGLMLRSAGKIINLPVEHRERTVGQSGYSMRKLLGLWLNGFTAFSIKPLRLATAMGGIFAAGGFLFAFFVVVRKLMFGSAIDAGWSSIVCLLLIIGGMLMAMLGLVGEYIGRIYVSMNAAPQYIIREKMNFTGPEETQS